MQDRNFPKKFNMKKYTINVHFDMVITEEVIAEDYQSARNLAELQAQGKSLDKESECYGVDSCLVEEEDLPQQCKEDEISDLSGNIAPVKNWADVERLLKGRVRQYYKFIHGQEDSEPVPALMKSLVTVGDGFRGNDTLMEATLTDGRFLQVRKILSKGFGATYRLRRPNAFVAQICKSNRWSEEIHIDTEEGIRKFVNLLLS